MSASNSQAAADMPAAITGLPNEVAAAVAAFAAAAQASGMPAATVAAFVAAAQASGMPAATVAAFVSSINAATASRAAAVTPPVAPPAGP